MSRQNQLPLDLPHEPVRTQGNFVVTGANDIAARMVLGDAPWPAGKLVLSGPPGSGKSHLAQVWARQAGATWIQASALTPENAEGLAAAPCAVEDVPAIAGQERAQRALFHLHNMAAAAGQPLLMTGRGAPGRWNLGLRDLQSRIDAAIAVALNPPDDILLEALLRKLFADRQTSPRPQVIPYILPRMERSFETAARLVKNMDRAAIAAGTAVTVPIARVVLENDINT